MAEKILITGTTGFVGASVLDAFLKKGYHVRATARSQKRADAVLAKYAEYKDKLEFVLVDLLQPEAFNNVLQGITAVVHVAAPLPNAYKTSVKTDFLDPTIEGTLGLLRAAAKFPAIRRVIITSAKVTLVDKDKDISYVYTEKDWNPITYEEVVTAEGNVLGAHGSLFQDKTAQIAFMGYVGAKTLAEKAAWKFVEENKPSFELVTVIPPWIFGPTDQVIESLDDLSPSVRFIYDYITTKTEVEAPQTSSFSFIDVRDLAVAHVLALENPKAANQRFLVISNYFTFQAIVDAAHKYFPGQTNAPTKRNTDPGAPQLRFNVSKSRDVLGLTYRYDLEATARDTIAQLLQLQKEGKLVQSNNPLK